jgi:fructose-1,6-bisphosphatase I
MQRRSRQINSGVGRRWEALVDEVTGTDDDLAEFLEKNARPDVARVLIALAETSIVVTRRIRSGSLAGALHADVGPAKEGVAQRALDVFADEAFVAGMRGAGVRGVVSEGRKQPIDLDADGRLLVAIDPLDASSNVAANVTIGTIFSVLDAPPRLLDAAGEPVAEEHFLQRGSAQRAAGMIVYGLHVAFVFTIGRGVAIATLDPELETFRIVTTREDIPSESNEFAINCANSRHWPAPVQAYVEDLLEGEEGPRERDFNMRWVGSMVADVYRILIRGGVYLYPEDSREGYEHGRLRLLYEANPVAFLIEQAGGAAIDGYRRILAIQPESIHARTPLLFGAKEKIERIARYYDEEGVAVRAPLFGKRGLLRR